MSNRYNQGSNIVFFLLGAATGAAIALLYAPHEGETTRRKLGEKAGEYKDKATEYSSTVTQMAKDRYGDIADTVSSKATDLINRVQKKAKSSVDDAADTAYSAVNGLS